MNGAQDRSEAERNLILRPSTSEDAKALERLYRAGFPEEDLLPLVAALSAHGSGAVSVLAVQQDLVIGHVMLTPCAVAGSEERVALLGPLVVDPVRQKRGIGGRLVHSGLRQMTERGAMRALVLGDPAYYGRFGFRVETDIATPLPIPDAWRTAWQSLVLREGGGTVSGVLAPPAPWMQPALWMP